MIDLFCIFTTGGLILWYKTFVDQKFEGLINNLIRTVLLDEKKNQDYAVFSGTVMRWRINNEAGLIFVVAYQESYSVLYVDQLLEYVVNDFIKNQISHLKRLGKFYLETPNYTDSFMNLLKKWEKYCADKLASGRDSNIYKSKSTREKSSKKTNDKENTPNNDRKYLEDNEEEVNTFDVNKSTTPNNSSSTKVNPNIPLKKQMSRTSAPNSKKEVKPALKKGKESRVWTNEFQEATKDNMNKLEQ
jgi:hypothetical protein